MTKILLAWIGMTDVRCSRKKQEGLGPIGMAAVDREYDEIQLLANDKPASMNEYTKWLSGLSRAKVKVNYVNLSNPTEYGEIYEAAKAHIEEIKSNNPKGHLVYHLSPGTPAMSSVWIMLAKSIHPAELISSSIENGVKTVLLPFELYAEYLGQETKTSKEVKSIIQDTVIDANAFESIKYKCNAMKILIAKAHRVAQFDLPVLIEGESGTGKELLAEAIHNSSNRKAKPFIAVNCGAIPKELFESEFFGYIKGAFTGANAERSGFIEDAHKGTLFLDEIGEMPLEMQVKLLRALQQKVIRKVGGDKEIKIDFRIIAATNKVLLDEVARGNFREDLFHRLAIGVIKLLPLRKRREDLSMLIDIFTARLNERTNSRKKISVSARNIMVNHPWPGNIRELENTLSRIFIWSVSDTISDKDVLDNLFPVTAREHAVDPILDRDIEQGVDLKIYC